MATKGSATKGMVSGNVPEGFGDEQEVVQGQFKFEKVGDKVAGILISKGQSDSFKAGVYQLEIGPGASISFLGKTTLDKQMSSVPLGAYVTVEYSSDELTKQGRSVKMFDVKYRLPKSGS